MEFFFQSCHGNNLIKYVFVVSSRRRISAGVSGFGWVSPRWAVFKRVPLRDEEHAGFIHECGQWGVTPVGQEVFVINL